MKNSIKKTSNLITPENSASFLPIIISSVIGILIIIFFVMPEFIKSKIVNVELNEIIRKKDELENLKMKYEKISKELNNLNNEKLKITKLISGTSNLDTLLANLGIIGNKNNIQFLSIVPKKLEIYIDNKKTNNINKNSNQELIVDPLLVDGIKKYLIDFSFKADFINLLSFLRELEFQENIILINDIDVKVSENNVNLEKSNKNDLDVKLSMTFYGKT
tara:strand:- start:294 stop:950 length:657 start_codon:yes stop_codon:yes gene_type:complete